jgi:predicted HTH transcriptional regulator
LNEEELIGLDFIKTNISITRKDYETKFNFDKKKAERRLKQFVELKLILRKGSGTSTYYEIATK